MFGRNETNWELPKNSHDCCIIKNHRDANAFIKEEKRVLL